MRLINERVQTRPEPPGPVERLLTRAGRADPYPLYEEIRAMGGAATTPWDALLLTGYYDCSRVLADTSFLVVDSEFRLSRHPDWQPGAALSQVCQSLVLVNRPDHTRFHRLFGRVFTPRALARLSDTCVRIVDGLLHRLAVEIHEHGVADFVPVVADALPMAVLGELFGIPLADHPRLLVLAHEYGQVLDILPTAQQHRAADLAAIELRHYLSDLIRERLGNPGDDLMSLTLQNAPGVLTDEELLSNLELILVAGLETTSGHFSATVKALSDFPEQAVWLREHPDAVDEAVEEVLRYDPPAQWITRLASKDTVIGDQPVRAGQLVHLMVGAAHRDPLRYEAPDRLDFNRPPQHSLSFGGGIHHCLGAALARLESRALLPALIDRMPDLCLAAEPVRRVGMNIRSFESMPVSLIGLRS